jgi:hypothetical protein
MRLRSFSIKIGAVITTVYLRAPAPEPHNNDVAPHPACGTTITTTVKAVFTLEPDRDTALLPFTLLHNVRMIYTFSV